jgi:PKD repeat protein
MKKQFMAVVCIVLLGILFVCGCTEQTAVKEKSNEPSIPSNTLPMIQDCHAEYFDMSTSATVYLVGVASDNDGTVVLYSWNLSDGFTTNQQSFIHTFPHPGAYQARLTVMDDKGATNSTSITVYVYDTSNENRQNDQIRIVGRWENTQGTIVEFTSDSQYLIPANQMYDRYWFSAGGLYIHSNRNNETLRYDYSFQGDNTLVFFPAGHPPAAQDTWTRIH